jgi:serine/threonine protein phosphatase PrpC
MKIECISIAGSGRMNEDAYVINQEQHVFAVVDGVSSLQSSAQQTDAEKTSGAKAAELVKHKLEAIDGETLLTASLVDANEALREKMLEAKVDLEKKEELWGAAAAVVRVLDRHIEYAQTGDCMIFAVYTNDTVRALTHPQVQHLESRAFAKWEEGISQGLSTREALIASCRGLLEENRYFANTPGGYGVLNGDPACHDYLEYGRINRSDVKALVLLTDGLFMLRPHDGAEPRWEETVLPIVHKGLQRYTDELLALENSDPECTRYVRFKKSDDKTGIYIHLA